MPVYKTSGSDETEGNAVEQERQGKNPNRLESAVNQPRTVSFRMMNSESGYLPPEGRSREVYTRHDVEL